ncbi:MAG: helix-hairpin-helix domain-containing protein [Acholeplasmataceae bacterium]|jgi:competence protein ComEA|nr:helix-hairpin-helix domain-containing protein [Acholeplasmataceae bacterium]
MKKILIVFGLTLFLAFAVIPKKEDPIYVHQTAVELNMFEVTIEGPFPYAGTYHFFEPITILEALKYAGEPYQEIDDTSIVYSELITRNKTIDVPEVGMEPNQPNLLVNINEASFKELLEIPHMTEQRAASLIIYRESNGPFFSIDDLIHVKYIGQVTLENLRPYITCS